jgi:hypothetical protein
LGIQVQPCCCSDATCAWIAEVQLDWTGRDDLDLYVMSRPTNPIGTEDPDLCWFSHMLANDLALNTDARVDDRNDKPPPEIVTMGAARNGSGGLKVWFNNYADYGGHAITIHAVAVTNTGHMRLYVYYAGHTKVLLPFDSTVGADPNEVVGNCSFSDAFPEAPGAAFFGQNGHTASDYSAGAALEVWCQNDPGRPAYP